MLSFNFSKAEETSAQHPLNNPDSAASSMDEIAYIPTETTQEEKSSRSLFDIIFGSSPESGESNSEDREKDSLVTVDETKEGSFASGGTIKVIDRTLGKLYLLDIETGSSKNLNELTIKLIKCWDSSEKTLTPEAKTFIDIYEKIDGKQKKIYSGWMISNHPSLSFLEHPKYDISLLKCGPLSADEKPESKKESKKVELPSPIAEAKKGGSSQNEKEQAINEEEDED